MEEDAEKCEGLERDRPVLARGAAMAMDMLHSHELGVYTSNKANPHLVGV